MNILLISSLGVKEKGAQSIRMTIEGYAKTGHKVFFITPQKSKSRDYYYDKDHSFNNKNIKVIEVLLPLKWLSSKSGKLAKLRYFYLFGLVAFIKGLFLCKNKNINLVYGYEVWGIFPSYYLSKVFKIPLISRFQGTILHPILENKANNKVAVRRVWEHIKAMKFSANMYIMTNDGTRGDEVLRTIGIPKKKIRFWMNGVNKKISKQNAKLSVRKKYKIPNNAIILITLHRLVPWKKTERAINAMKAIRSKNVYLMVIGDGERKSYLEKYSKEMGVNDRVIFTGAISNNNIHQYLSEVDIYLGTYDLSNAGNPLFESMLSGLAIVTLNNGTTKDFVNQGKAAKLLDREEDFSSAIDELVGDTKKLDLYKKLAYDYSHSNFWTWDERIKKEVNEVEEIVRKFN